MKHKNPVFIFCILCCIFLFGNTLYANFYFNIFSPDKQSQLNFQLTREGLAYYSYFVDKKTILKQGKLGIRTKEGPSFESDFELLRIDTFTRDETWKPIWGEESEIRDHALCMNVHLKQKRDQLEFIIEFRLYDNGFGFRYSFPAQKGLYNFIIADERTSFPLTGDHKTFWIPGDYDTNEYVYSRTRLSEINALKEKKENGIAFKWLISDSTVQTPLTMKTEDGYYISIHEAALVNYPAMNLDVQRNANLLTAHLVPDAYGNKAYLHAGSKSPWRVVLVARKAGELLSNRIILNLNEPNTLTNTDFIKPGKFLGVWWEMHVGKSSWDYSGKMGWEIPYKDLQPSGRHGANTEHVKKYIDFASTHGIPYLLVEGWNTGWEDWFGSWKERVFSFTTAYPDFNTQEISNYAKAKNVKLLMHHETSSAVTDYERQMDSAYQFMKQYEYGGVKTGYVGKIIPRGEHHDGQWMINHYVRVAQKTGQYGFMLDAHEPVRPTGLHRTYPNWMACEAARGNEFNAWSLGNPPEHECILPFTRLLGGPMDYTPGIFQIKMNIYDSTKKEQVHTTLCKQLALYVTMYSPLQMAADLIENYQKNLDAFQFIKDVPTDWDRSIVLDAEPGDYVYMARKDKKSKDWYLGAITNEQTREFSPELNFLEEGLKYEAQIYMDGAAADWQKNPMDFKIEKRTVKSSSRLKIKLAAGGGCAIRLKALLD